MQKGRMSKMTGYLREKQQLVKMDASPLNEWYPEYNVQFFVD